MVVLFCEHVRFVERQKRLESGRGLPFQLRTICAAKAGLGQATSTAPSSAPASRYIQLGLCATGPLARSDISAENQMVVAIAIHFYQTGVTPTTHTPLTSSQGSVVRLTSSRNWDTVRRLASFGPLWERALPSLGSDETGSCQPSFFPRKEGH